MTSLLIKNGLIIDGRRTKAYRGDLAIENGKITRIGNLAKMNARRVVDAAGLVVAPGFVDILNHSDSYYTLFDIPTFESMVRQGVTTVLIGNCGSSLAPLIEPASLISLQKWMDISEANVNWLKVGELLDELERKKFGVNIATLVGHATLRRGIVREEFRELKREELDRMKLVLEEALQEGAFGLSTGLAYSHAKFASLAELRELVQIVKNHGALYTTHLRDESKDFLRALNETINLARETGASFEISHFKVMGETFWPYMERALGMIDASENYGLDINFDVYPYVSIGSVLYIFLPDWVSRGGKKMLLARLKEHTIRERLIKEMKANHYDYEKIIIAFSPHNKTLVGKSISEIASNEEVGPEEAILNALAASDGRIIAFMSVLGEENVVAAVRHKQSFIASDGFGYRQEHRFQGKLVHPRCFGSFPRFLAQYVREKRMINWEEAVQKISSGPARKVGLKLRGEISKDYFADLTLFDPQTVRDLATFKDPFQYPLGIPYVIVNGEIVVEGEKLTGKLPGRILRRV